MRICRQIIHIRVDTWKTALFCSSVCQTTQKHAVLCSLSEKNGSAQNMHLLQKGDCLQRVSGGNPTGHAGRRKGSYSTSTSRGDVHSSSKVAWEGGVYEKRRDQADHCTGAIILQRDSMRSRIFPQSGHVQRHNLLGLGPASIRPSPAFLHVTKRVYHTLVSALPPR